jgi:uncharacterized membrane protein
MADISLLVGVAESRNVKSPSANAGAKPPLSPARRLVYGLAIAGLAVLVACLLSPSVVWDQFVFRYFWGSTEADALGHPVNGVTEDYNLISTVVYGILLAAAVYLIYTGFKRRGIRIDLNYILALVPFVLFGTLTRAMEDSFYFSLPAAYIFISPQIYVLVGALVIGLTLLSRRLGRKGAIALLWAMVPVYCLFFIGGYRGQMFSEPTVLPAATLVLLTAVLSYLVYRRGNSGMDTPLFLAHFGIQSVAVPLFAVAYWCARPGVWGPVNEAGWKLHPAEMAVIPALAVGATLLVWGLLWLAARRSKGLAPMAAGTSILIFSGHFLDAAATYRALDFFSYGEKHVLSNYLIEKAGTALVMFPMKAVAIGAILYILEVEFRKDLEKDAILPGLLRAALLILGLSPGLRDLFRLVMGV